MPIAKSHYIKTLLNIVILIWYVEKRQERKRFSTGFYGLTDMPAEFCKALYSILVGPSNTYCFLDDIIIILKGSQSEHLELVYKCPKKLIKKILP